MERLLLRDDQWARLAPLCAGKQRDRGVTAKDNRLFLEAVLWIARTGSPWRDLPKEFGNWHSVYVRFARWCEKGTWARLAEAVSGDPDLEMLFIDSTIVRAHQHAAGAQKEGPQDIGRSRGGLTTKIHAAVDGSGNPVRLLLTGGEVADIAQAQALIDGFDALSIVADKGYDSNAFVLSITSRNAEAVIPSRKNRIIGREYDHHVYKDRNLVERFFNRIKQFRRLATRYEKLARRFMAMLHLVFAFIWLQ